jgi:hypothetical protein
MPTCFRACRWQCSASWTWASRPSPSSSRRATSPSPASPPLRTRSRRSGPRAVGVRAHRAARADRRQRAVEGGPAACASGRPAKRTAGRRACISALPDESGSPWRAGSTPARPRRVRAPQHYIPPLPVLSAKIRHHNYCACSDARPGPT